ncbi:MAG: zinc-binding dehydrogenase, partial [Parvularculaceae bacterium]|nr:zinc-binding dehydrogenase [Parvularculaceae bacterium]
DTTIDYKNEDVRARLKALAPNGVDIFFDNVGGDILQAAVDHMARRGRIVVCGQIASYNDDATAEGPRNMMRIVYGSIRLEGFLRSDYMDHVDEAVSRLREWTDGGELVHRVDLRRGFDAIPSVFAELFTGGNSGTLLIEVDDKP